MPKIKHNALTPAKIRALTPGAYADGGGLTLKVDPSGGRRWYLRVTDAGRRRNIGLGGYPAVSLAMARERAGEYRTAVADGRDPTAERIGPGLPTFRQTAELHVEAYRGRWRNARAVSIFNNRLERYVFPTFGAKRVDRITQADVLSVLTPIWSTKHETGRRVRQQVRAVFSYAMAHGHIQINPAGELIDAALPTMPAVKEHFRALPYQEVTAALAAVEDSGASLASRSCFRFLVLTAARSGEARGARWDEIDLDSATWTIASERMKSGAEHRVPLSRQALDVLLRMLPLRGDSGLVFPSAWKPGSPLSDMTLTKLLRDLGLADRATVHGFRTGFKTWCMEQTDTPWAVGEAALAHTIGNSVEAAYARTDLFDKRRALMQLWADFAQSGRSAGRR